MFAVTVRAPTLAVVASAGTRATAAARATRAVAARPAMASRALVSSSGTSSHRTDRRLAIRVRAAEESDTATETTPKVETNMANIRATIDQLKKALENVNEKSKAWKEKYGIKTQQEMELEKRNAQASGGAVKAATGVLA